MSYLYVCEQGAIIGVSGGRIEIKYKEGMLKSIPVESMEIIEVFGNVQITSQCIAECLKKGINIIFFSSYGSYYGRLISTNHVNVSRQRKQAALNNNEKFKLEFARKVLNAKIRNQIVILRRYSRYQKANIEHEVTLMKFECGELQRAENIAALMGYEGHSARLYFQALGKLIDEDFSFSKRTKRPPMDPFNSLISLGYSIILNEIYGKIEGKGLNPYFGLIHKDKEKHPSLASDLMEEWRAVLIDSTALSLLNGHELLKEDFYQDSDGPGVFLTNDAFKKYINKLESKLRTSTKYLSYVDYEVSFRRAMDLQVGQLLKAIEAEDPEAYTPIMIR